MLRSGGALLFHRLSWHYLEGRGVMFHRLCADKKKSPLFEELRQTSQDLFESESESHISWDVCLNSPKSGGCFFRPKNTFLHKNVQLKKNSGVEK